MAEIENGGALMTTRTLGALTDAQLLGQDLVQQGAVHALSWLMTTGCTEATAAAMLASLRANAALIREEARRRGKPDLFEHDQVVFS